MDAIKTTDAAAESAAVSEKKDPKKHPHLEGWKKDLRKNGTMYLLFIPAAVFFIIFSYVPMIGIVMAFQEVNATAQMFGDKWVGWDNFVRLFTSTASGNFLLAMRNTFIMALLNITVGFIFPIILALLVSEVRSKTFKRTTQTVTYMPYFISAVIICSLVTEFVDDDGAVTAILSLFGYDGGNLLENENPPVFWLINLFTDIWQNAGYSSIVFVAAIANVDKELYEAAAMDGANRFRRAWSVTLPSILPTIVMMFTIKIGTVLTTGFDKVILLYNPGIYDTADCLYSYTYRMTTGEGGFADFGLSAASGLFQSVLSVVLLFASNALTKLVAKTSLF